MIWPNFINPCFRLSRRRRGSWILLLGCLFFLVGARFESQAASAHFENRDYLIDNWQGRDELHENSALALAQTPDGYLWIGTYGGLVRFNGQDFIRAKSLPENPLTGETIYSLNADPRGRLWVATDKEIAVLENRTWRIVEAFKKNPIVIRSFATDAGGQLWAGTLDGRLFAITNGHWGRMTSPTNLFRSGVFCCTDAQDGSLWLANRAYIGHLTTNGWQSVGEPASDYRPLLAAAARDGGIWVYFQREHSLQHFHADGSVEKFNAPAINEIRELFEDHNGMVWIGSTLTGLARIKPGDVSQNFAVTIKNGLANNVVLAITEDRENNLWVGTGSVGLHKLVPRRFSNFGLEEGLPNPITRTVIEEAPGQIIVGTHGGGIARIRDGQVTALHTNLPAANYYIWTALHDSRGRLWFGTFNGGLFYEDNGVQHPFTKWPTNLGNTINALFEDSQHRIWVGTHSGLGVIENNQARAWATTNNNPLAQANIRCLAEEKISGALWLGTYDDGLFRLAGDRLDHFGISNGVPGHVTSLALDADGCVWAGISGQGLICIRDGKISVINRINGLPADMVGSILEDGSGYFWLGTDRGVLRVSNEALHRTARNPGTMLACDIFNHDDGLTDEQCAGSFQNTALHDSTGRLWFVTQKGVVNIVPNTLHLNTNIPPVFIEQVSYTDRTGKKNSITNFNTFFRLPAGASDLKIDYAALSLTAPDKVTFAFYLQEPSLAFAETNQLRSEIFRKLDAGRYRFEIRAANNDGVWNRQGATLIFFVEPFVWQTAWFWTLALGTLAAIIGFGGWVLARTQLRRQLVQLNLRREHMRLAAVMEATSDLVVFADGEKNILHINPAGRRLLGRAAGALKNLSELHPPAEFWRLIAEAIPAAEKSGTWEGETLVTNHAGQTVPVSQVLIVSKDDAGKINFISAIARDISERKRAEENQTRLEEQLRQSQKMEAVGQLSGGVAHDFNNLLAVISGNVSLLEMDGTLLPEQREAMDEIKFSAERAAALTRQLLAFSRRQTLSPANLNLNDVVENMGKIFRRILGEDIRLKLNFSLPRTVVQADAGMMEQVLLNLVVNARDAMPAGGELEISIDAVTLDAAAAARMPGARPGTFAVLSVQDNVAGIAPEILTHIFEPFFTTKDVGKGTGLGLATVFGIVQQHHGWLIVHSQPGQGATFQIHLPLLAEDVPTKTVASAPPPLRGGHETVLLVEDEPALRKLVIRALTRLGYRVVDAATGVQALAVWEKNRDDVRLLLTDMVMPDGIGGIELARRLRAENPALPVIFMSGYNAGIASQSLELVEGVNFIPKPFEQSVLAKAVRNALDAGAK